MRSVSQGCERGLAAQRAPPVLSREGLRLSTGLLHHRGGSEGLGSLPAPHRQHSPTSMAPLPPRRPRVSSHPCGVSGLTGGLTAAGRPAPSSKHSRCTTEATPKPPAQNKDVEGRKSPSQPWGLHKHSPTPSEGRGHRQQRGFPEGRAVWPHVHGTCLPAAPLPAPQGSPAHPPVLFITQTPHVALQRGTDPSCTSSPPGAARTRALCLIRIRSSLLLLHFFSIKLHLHSIILRQPSCTFSTPCWPARTHH